MDAKLSECLGGCWMRDDLHIMSATFSNVTPDYQLTFCNLFLSFLDPSLPSTYGCNLSTPPTEQ